MARSPRPGTTVAWLALAFLLVAAATAAAFCVFVPGPERKTTFYICLSLAVAAELVVFSHLAHSRVAGAQVPTATTATRIQVQGLIFLWLVLTIVAGALASRPDTQDTLSADRILIIDLILTVIFFLVAYALYTKDLEVAPIAQALAESRRPMLANLAPVREAMRLAEALGRRQADCAVLADQVRKKLDTICTQIEAAPVSERLLVAGGEADASSVAAAVARFAEISQRGSSVAPEQASEWLREVSAQGEALSSALRDHGRSLTT